MPLKHSSSKIFKKNFSALSCIFLNCDACVHEDVFSSKHLLLVVRGCRESAATGG